MLYVIKKTQVLLVGLVVLTAPLVGSASPLLETVGDTLSTAAMQPRTLAGGSAAAYFNPSLLLDSPAEIAVGLVVLRQSIGVTLYGRPGPEYAIPDGIENGSRSDGTGFESYGVGTNLLQFGKEGDTPQASLRARPRQGAGTGHDTGTYASVGMNVHLFDGKFALGFHGLVPNGDFTQLNAFYNDEREQYFSNSLHAELYSDRMTAISFGAGACLKITDELSLGLGATLGLQAGVQAAAFVADASQLGDILIDVTAPVNISVAPHFGVSYHVTDRVHLTATAHAPKQIDLNTNFTFLLASGVEQESGIQFVLDYSPWMIGTGGELVLVENRKHRLALATSLLFAQWSTYINRHGERPRDSYAWADTLSATGGVRYRFRDLTTLVDVGYVPSPVPEQTGRENYVDNDRFTSALGAQYEIELWGTPMRVGALFNALRLIPRENHKRETPTDPGGDIIQPDLVVDEVPDDARLGRQPVPGAAGLQTNNPGWPGFESRGWVLSGSVYLAISI